MERSLSPRPSFVAFLDPNVSPYSQISPARRSGGFRSKCVSPDPSLDKIETEKLFWIWKANPTLWLSKTGGGIGPGLKLCQHSWIQTKKTCLHVIYFLVPLPWESLVLFLLHKGQWPKLLIECYQRGAENKWRHVSRWKHLGSRDIFCASVFGVRWSWNTWFPLLGIYFLEIGMGWE